MIPWRKFQYDDEPTYSDNVYHPTASILANQVPILAHQVSLLNAPPLENADDRRFVVSQLSPEQRERHLNAFHHMHTSRMQLAIDTLANYFERHEEKPLSSYDREGRPDDDWQRSRFERVRKLDERCEAVFTRPESYVPDGDLSDHSADSKTDYEAYEAYYDFEDSLPGLILDFSNGLFDMEALHKPELLLAPELSLSPASTCAPLSSDIAPLEDLLQHSDLPSSSTLPPSLPSLTTTAATFSSLLPTTASLVATTNPALSIANLIHPTPLSATSTTFTDPEISNLVSTVLDDIATRHMSNSIPISPLIRTVREPRMRRPSRPRGNKSGPRGSNSALEKTKLEVEGQREMERIQLRNRSITESERERQDGQSQLSPSYSTSFSWSRYIVPGSVGVPSQPQVKTELSGYAASQLPTAAIKYEPLDHTERALEIGRKRKQREYDTAEQSAHHRPSPYARATSSTASQWQPPYHVSSTRFTNMSSRHYSSPHITPRPQHPS
jgi:hypothetical protein